MGLQQAIDGQRYRYMSGRGVLIEDEIPAIVIDRLFALGDPQGDGGRCGCRLSFENGDVLVRSHVTHVFGGFSSY
jgi:hypothetical protein